MSISFLPPPVVLKTMSSFTFPAGMESASTLQGVPEKGTGQRLCLGLGRSKAGCFPHYKIRSQNQDSGRGWPIDSPIGINSALPSLTASFFGASISALIKDSLTSELFMSVFVFPHEIVNFYSAGPRNSFPFCHPGAGSF